MFPFNLKKEKALDILSAMDIIADKRGRFRPFKRYVKIVEPYTSFLSQKLEIEKMDALFLSTMMADSDPWTISNFCNYFRLNNIKMMRYASCFENLVAKKFISKTKDDDGKEMYEVRDIVRKTFSKNEPYKFDPQKETIVIDRDSDEIIRLSPDDIVSKDMFYNDDEKAQIDDIVRALQADKYNAIHAKMIETHQKTNFSCLFYGGPGTGKTETAKQIAKITGREIFFMNLSETRSMWHGESEKKVKSMFDKYRKAVNESTVTPILFINEADAILSRRSENPFHSQIDNPMKNVILQELEDLDGIMFATTNFANSLDTAMERRFFYKIEFHQPEPKVRAQIWKSKIQTLSDDFAQKLAKDFDFSGGVIDNVNRKCIIYETLHNESVSEDKILEFCSQERISDNHHTKGFLS